MPHGDFTFDPFHYRDGVSRVLIQQGRVQLDSDANEQTETILRFLRGLGRDVIGPHGGVGDSFFIEFVAGPPVELRIRRGEYYVDGIRCVLPQDGDLWEIIDDPTKAAARQSVPLNSLRLGPETNGMNLLLYLDVFERHVSSAEDDSLREVALLGADTASRAVIVWQVRALVIDTAFRALQGRAVNYKWPFVGPIDDWYAALNVRLRTGIRMRAQAIGSDSTNPCIISPEARYRGTENRLFRVEIHDAGTAAVTSPPSAPVRPPTFKWSADNGSIAYPIVKVTGTTLHLGSLGRDARTQLCVNDWVEVVDDDLVLNPRFDPLLQVLEVHPENMTVVLSAAPDATVGSDPAKHPILRRWASDLVPIPSLTVEHWFELTDGVQIAFSRVPKPEGGFRPGDYWLIPTRTANGELAWPRDGSVARAMPPNGIEHHYAPLATWQDRASPTTAGKVDDVRRTFEHLAGLPKPPKP